MNPTPDWDHVAILVADILTYRADRDARESEPADEVAEAA